jgi:hypothetical protein
MKKFRDQKKHQKIKKKEKKNESKNDFFFLFNYIEFIH